MSGDGVMLDTNVILGYLKGDKSIRDFIQTRLAQEWYVSVITRIELLSFPSLRQDEDAAIQDFLGYAIIVTLSEKVEKQAVRLRRETKCKTPDAIIAASAICMGASLVTLDRKLAAVEYPGLRTVNPI